MPSPNGTDLKVSLNFQVPLDLKLALMDATSDGTINESDFCRKAIADALGYDLPTVASRAGRGLTEEQKAARKAERDAANKAKRDEIAAAIEAHKKAAVAA